MRMKKYLLGVILFSIAMQLMYLLLNMFHTHDHSTTPADPHVVNVQYTATKPFVMERRSNLQMTRGQVRTIQWYDYNTGNNKGSSLRGKAKNVNFSECTVKNCVFLQTYFVNHQDARFGHWLEADAVLIHYIHATQFDPPVRRNGQVFVMVEREPWQSDGKKPSKSPMFDGLYNWTMTYRRDSDIVLPYARIQRKGNVPLKNFTNIFRQKSKDIVWLVSHCDTDSKRELYVEELRKYIDVDIYGACGTFQCTPYRQGEHFNKTACIRQIIRDYKFHLAFENFYHTDYVTEKFFDWFSSDIISITMGGTNYSDIAPHGSYIDVADFKSPRHLASYLNTLKYDEDRYIQYLSTKNEYYTEYQEVMQQVAYCQLCEMLNNIEKYQKTYRSVHKWWANAPSDSAIKYLEKVKKSKNNKKRKMNKEQ